ncbi:hypothetical protein BGZ94_004648 [Podila epigama]|nr:hypothetical protein BGZ94_004648 [Podila epigama]
MFCLFFGTLFSCCCIYRKDVYVLFTEPVDPVLVPDYSTVIKNPMDLSLMRAKVERNFYPTIDEFLSDFQLVCDNARLYNAKDTLYWKQADKLWEWGSKAIERDRKTIMDKEEETLKTVKDEETLDIVGMGDHTLGAQMNRGSILSIDKGVDSPMSIPETGRPHTPQQYRKSKKIKHRRDGTIALSYATDGSIDPASHPDPWSLVPAGPEFGAQPIVTPISRATSGDYNGSYLDDYPYDAIFRSTSRPSQFQDFGPFALLDTPQNNGNTSGLEQIPAYTGMIFGDARGEALVRSLVRFMEPIVSSQDSEAGTIEPGQQLVQEFIRAKIEKLTRGASTIVDKVAAVVREEKFGQPTGVDTRVPLSLWNQGSLKAKDLKTEKDVKKEPVDSEMPLAQQDHVTDAKPAEGDQMAVDVVSDDSKVEGSGSSNVPDKDVEMTSKDEEGPKVEEGPKDEVASKDVAALKDEASPNSIRDSSKEESMIDIRKVIQDIKAWPLIQRKRADYQAWKQLKIELDSLLPASRRVTEPAAAPPAEPPAGEDDIIEVMWGVKWTGGDSEESKRWVREYLETNSKEMLQIVQILAEKSPRSASATATSLNGSDGSVSAPSATASLTDSERELVETTTKNIRKRLVEMAQYVPLSEINPKHLPLPKAPPPAAASASASASTPAPAPVSADPTPTTTTASESVNTSTQSTAAPAAPSSTAPLAEPPATVTTTPATPTTPAPAVETTVPPSSSNTTTATTATPLQRSYVPSDGSASSLSSPGSSP